MQITQNRGSSCRLSRGADEFMLSEALPTHSDGVGRVAGDQLKIASDLGVPVVWLLYQQGYFRQVINKDGAQHSPYENSDLHVRS